MKKMLFFAAAAAMMLASCSEKMDFTQADLQNAANSPSNEVQFGTYMGRTATTRAGAVGAMTNESLKNATAGFGVFGYYSGTETMATWSSWDGTNATPAASTKAPNFMYNQEVTWSTSSPAEKWNYSPVKYWPNGIDLANSTTPSNTATEANPQYLSFFAYAPYVYQGTTAYSTTDTYVGGDLPSGVENAVYTGNVANPTAPEAVQNGIVAISKNTENKDMYVKYVLNQATETAAVDLLWGLRGEKTYNEADNTDNTVTTLGTLYNTDLTKQKVGEEVKFLFKHALSRVGGSTKSTTAGGGAQVCGVWVVVDVDKNSDNAGIGQSAQTTYFSSDFDKTTTLVTIEEVKIRDNYTYHYENNTSTTETSNFLTDGWFDIMNGKWYGTASVVAHTTGSHGATYSVTANNAPGSGEYNLNAKIKEGTPDNSTGAAWTTSNSGGAEGVECTTKKELFADEDVPGLLLIPGGGNNTLYITVKYHVRTADSNLSTGFSDVEQTITNKVTLDGSMLEPNKYYNLVMHLGLTSVKFEAVVADWASTTDGTYDENGGETPSGEPNYTSIWLPSNVVE